MKHDTTSQAEAAWATSRFRICGGAKWLPWDQIFFSLIEHRVEPFEVGLQKGGKSPRRGPAPRRPSSQIDPKVDMLFLSS